MGSFEPLGVEPRMLVDIHLAEAFASRVDEPVRDAGRRDDDLAAADDAPLVRRA